MRCAFFPQHWKPPINLRSCHNVFVDLEENREHREHQDKPSNFMIIARSQRQCPMPCYSVFPHPSQGRHAFWRPSQGHGLRLAQDEVN